MSDEGSLGFFIVLIVIGVICFAIGWSSGQENQRKIYCNHKNMTYQEINDEYYCQDKLKLYPIEWLQHIEKNNSN